MRGLQRACVGGLGEDIHYGPTTQGIEDTGDVLELRHALGILLRDLRTIEGALAVSILSAAIRKAGKDPMKIREAIFSTKRFPGALGTDTFMADGGSLRGRPTAMIKSGRPHLEKMVTLH